MTDTMRENEMLKDSVRCMSIVMDDIALELGIEPHDYGDPDLIFDKIETLQAVKADAKELVRELVKALEIAGDQVHSSNAGWEPIESALTKAQAWLNESNSDKPQISQGR